MRLLIWNVHKGIGGMDRRYALWRIAAVLRHEQPDVVLLQEVDELAPRSRRDRQIRMLGEALEFPHTAYGPNVRLKSGRWGNGTLSRFPIAASSNLDLSFSRKKPRGALFTEVHAPVGEHHLVVHFVNLHLGLSGVERRWQVRRLLASPAIAELDRRSRIVIAGDTNDWSGALSRGGLRTAAFACVTGSGVRALRTFPAWGPVAALDRVFLRGPIHCSHAFRPRVRLARIASDHLPVVVDLELKHA